MRNDKPKFKQEGTNDFYTLDYPPVDKHGTVLAHTHLEGSMHTIILKLVDAHRRVVLALDRCRKKLPVNPTNEGET